MASALDEYRRKRDFRRTSEPDGSAQASHDGAPRFVIQRHESGASHYDVRLEADGVLKSWAVPKGPSTDVRERRLAVATEDHPLDYADFEGVIEEGEYGAGTVIVWDAGPYQNLTEEGGDELPVERAIDAGHVVVWLDGEKLHGGYALHRFRGEDQWLLTKMRGEGADARRNPVSTQPASVLSGRTNDDLEHEASG